MSQRLADPQYLAFPFRLGAEGPAWAHRREHIRQQIEQVLFTNPGERVFELDFGAGAKRMVFEPNNSVLLDLATQRVSAGLAEALRGEVDPKSLEVTAKGEGDVLYIHVRYRLVTIDRDEAHSFVVGGDTDG